MAVVGYLAGQDADWLVEMLVGWPVYWLAVHGQLVGLLVGCGWLAAWGAGWLAKLLVGCDWSIS